jgi:hypothetical protein
VRLEGLGQLKKSNDFKGNQIRNLPACSTVPQPTTLPRTLYIVANRHKPEHEHLAFYFILEEPFTIDAKTALE